MAQEHVQVIVIKQTEQQTQDSNLLQHLLDHPLKIDSFTPLQRDEIYVR
jgi:hypothetical protein